MQMIEDSIKWAAVDELSKLPEQKVRGVKQVWVLEFDCPMDGTIRQCFTKQGEAVYEYHYRYGHHYMDDVEPPSLYKGERPEQGTVWQWERLT
jgi:hypothetical protein